MSALETGILVAAFSVCLAAILAFVVRLNGRLNEFDKVITRLDTQVSPLWAQVQARISSDLHHPHPRYFEMDILLEKLEALTITNDERERLKVLLRERSVDMHEDISESQRQSAKIMSGVMDKVVLESKENHEP